MTVRLHGWWDEQGDDTKRWLNIGSDGETACRTQVDETLDRRHAGRSSHYKISYA